MANTVAASYTALVAGSTGAVGRELVAELVASAKCAKVIALARRDIPQDQWTKSFPHLDVDAAKGKLEIRAVDFDSLSETNIKADDKIDAAFCCLGTTRKDAGSAEAFRKVDLEYTTRFAELSKTANVPYFGLLTAMNANKSSWFLYPQTKGEAEENIKALGFPRTGIFRPGLIDRGELARAVEKIGLWVMPSVTTRAIAKGIVADFESGSSSTLTELSNTDLKKFHMREESEPGVVAGDGDGAAGGEWVQMVDDDTQELYYVNIETHETTWTTPSAFIQHDSIQVEVEPTAAKSSLPSTEPDTLDDAQSQDHPTAVATLPQLNPASIVPLTPSSDTTHANHKTKAKTITGSSPPHDNGVATNHDNDDARLRSQYALYGFAVDHFRLAPPRRRLASPFHRPKTFDLETRLRWEKELLGCPLTSRLTSEQIPIGLQAFRNISGFMGNRSSGKGQIDHCFKLLRNVMPRATAIKDEIFCQLCKQLTANPDANAVSNGWLLLSACLVSFPPSLVLAPFLEQFFADKAGSSDAKTSQFATSCLASLHQWTAKSGKSERKEIPSLREIESLRDHTTVSMDVVLIDGTTHAVGVTSWTTCGELAETLAQRLGLHKKQAFTLFEVSPSREERRVDATERVLDMLALWERLGVEKVPKKAKSSKNKTNKTNGSVQHEQLHQHQQHHHLLYKVFLHVPLDDDMTEDLALVYKQAVHDVVHAIVVCPLDACIQLAAFQLFVANGAFQPSSSDTSEGGLPLDLTACLPSHLLSKTNRESITARVTDAYTALSKSSRRHSDTDANDADPNDDDLNDNDQHHHGAVSAQQIRLAYLKLCSSLRLFGSTFFAVHNTRNRAMPGDLVLAVNHKGLSLVSVANEAVLHHFAYVSISTWGYSANAFVFVAVAAAAATTTSSGDADEEVEYVFKTKTGKAINDLVAAYVAYILSCSSSSS